MLFRTIQTMHFVIEECLSILFEKWQLKLVITMFLQVETGKKTLILHGTKTSNVLNAVLTEIYHLKKDNAVKYTRKNDNYDHSRAVAKLLWSFTLLRLIAASLW